jgi:pimeloyl-ACP methyl ester carboxylesterase
LNFEIKLAPSAGDASAAVKAAPATPSGPLLETFDLVNLQTSVEMPSGVPAPIPAVLLLHGFGEDRTVWNDFKKVLLAHGWAVMTLDLRGHGESKIQNGRTITANKDWRTNPQAFPLDVDTAITWLKMQTRINSNKIAVIGVDVGANLALIASGRFQQVRTVVAVNPNLRESQEMAGGGLDFKPRSALVFSLTDADASALKSAVQSPVQVRTVDQAGGTALWFQNKQVTDAIFQWLKETF